MIKPSIESIQSTSDMNTISTILHKWSVKSDNLELAELSGAFVRLFTYTNSLELKEFSFENLISQMREDKNRAILRARRSEKRIEELEAKVKKLTATVKVFGGNID